MYKYSKKKESENENMWLNPFREKPLVSLYREFANREAFNDPDYWMAGQTLERIEEVARTDANYNEVMNRYAGWNARCMDLLTRFLILMLADDSPYAKETDLVYKQKMCIKTLGLNDTDDVSLRVCAEINDCTDLYSSMMLEYFKLSNRVEFENWFTLKLNYHELSQYLRAPAEDIVAEAEKKAKVQKMLGPLKKEMITLEHKLFPSAETAKLMAEFATEDSLGGFVEQRARPNPFVDLI